MKKPRCKNETFKQRGFYFFLSFPKNYFFKLRVILKKSLFEGYQILVSFINF